MPVSKIEDDRVIGGTVNQSGGLVIRADKVGRDTMLARIVDYGGRGRSARGHRSSGWRIVWLAGSCRR